MFRFVTNRRVWVALALSAPMLGAIFGTRPLLSSAAGSAAEPRVHGSRAVDESALECQAAKTALDAELAQLRQSCDVAVAAFEACRAARREWDDVEVFSCSFDMSTNLTRGELDDAASLEDCGTPRTTPASGGADARADCPVPSCEADLERLEAEAEARLC